MFLSEEVKGLGTIICSLLYFYYIFFQLICNLKEQISAISLHTPAKFLVRV